MSVTQYKKLLNKRVLSEQELDYLTDQLMFGTNRPTGILYSEISRIYSDAKHAEPFLTPLIYEVINEKMYKRHLPILN
jgi:hypothetical protein